MSLRQTDDPIKMIRESGADPEVLGRIWEHYRDRLLQLIHRHHLGTQMRDAGREVSLHRGAMPQVTRADHDAAPLLLLDHRQPHMLTAKRHSMLQPARSPR